MNRFKTVTLDTLFLPPKWVKSVLAKFGKGKRVYVEAIDPERDNYSSLERWAWRLTQVHPDWVCAELSKPHYDSVENTLSFQCEMFGPFAAKADSSALVPRYYENALGDKVPLPAFEFAPRS
jgi:hypothetical protein